VAAAVFGDATKVKFSQLNAKERFTALQSGEVDVLSRNTTWTSSRDAGMGLVFAGVTYYDGVGFLVNKKLGVSSAKELDGATICIQAGTTTELNVSDYFRANNLKYTPITFDTSDESAKSLESGRCDVLTSDKSQLFAQRSKLAAPTDYVVLPETISKEPLGPVVRKGDDEWFSIVKWTLFAMLNAEEAGITSKNVEAEAKSTKNPDVARLLGADGEYGKDQAAQRLGSADRQASRQLRRSVREEPRPEHRPEDRPWPERPVEQRRHPVRAACALMVAPCGGIRRRRLFESLFPGHFMQNQIGAPKGLSLSDPRVRVAVPDLTIVFVVGLGWYLFTTPRPTCNTGALPRASTFSSAVPASASPST
jgi:ABC-type amino acid transport substrate-binding protein